jgi:hypothetical protein
MLITALEFDMLLDDLGQIMWYLDIQVELLRETNDDERDIVSPHFRSDTYALLRHDPDGIDHDLNYLVNRWIMHNITSTGLHVRVCLYIVVV